MKAAAFLSALLAAVIPAAAAQSDAWFNGPRAYDDCIAAIDKSANRAFEQAMQWRDNGGGLAARHCIALALVALGHYGEAAVRLVEIARADGAGGPERRAELLGQAGNAWLLEESPENALKVFDEALKLAPESADLLADRGRTRAALADWRGAEDDLTLALRARPDQPDALTIRAQARRKLGDPGGARADLDRALALDPQNAGALIARGDVRAEGGDRAGARADYLAALKLEPRGLLADAAQTGLEALDVPAQ